MTKEAITQLKLDLIDLGTRITTSDRLIMQLKDASLKLYYTEQLLELINSYRQLEDLLKFHVNDYIQYEKEDGNIIDFTIRRLQKELKK